MQRRCEKCFKFKHTTRTDETYVCDPCGRETAKEYYGWYPQKEKWITLKNICYYIAGASTVVLTRLLISLL